MSKQWGSLLDMGRSFIHRLRRFRRMFSLCDLRNLWMNDLTLGREVADARLRMEGRIRHLDAHPAKTSVARFVQRREVQRILVSQLVRHFRIRRLKRIKRLR